MKKWRTLAFEGKTQLFETEAECRAAGEVIAQETGDSVAIENFDEGRWWCVGTVGTPKDWPDWQAPQDVALGDWVRTKPYGYLGRVFKVHPGYPAGQGCPQDDEWLDGQSHPVKEFKYARWVSILVHGEGSVVFPDALVERISDHPATLDNRYANQYFRQEEESVMKQTHYAMIVGSVPPSAEVIAHGPKEFCDEALRRWLDEHPLPEFHEGVVLKVEGVVDPEDRRGVEVTVGESAGTDGAIVVNIDTEFEPDGSDGGPGLRVLINDDPTYVGKDYEPIREQ